MCLFRKVRRATCYAALRAGFESTPAAIQHVTEEHGGARNVAIHHPSLRMLGDAGDHKLPYISGQVDRHFPKLIQHGLLVQVPVRHEQRRRVPSLAIDLQVGIPAIASPVHSVFILRFRIAKLKGSYLPVIVLPDVQILFLREEPTSAGFALDLPGIGDFVEHGLAN
jgi:hypothetical protein